MNRFTLLRSAVALLLAAGILTLQDRASAEERAYQARSTTLLNLTTGDFVSVGECNPSWQVH
jgi:hypothetical protein